LFGHYMYRVGTPSTGAGGIASDGVARHFQITPSIWRDMQVLPTFSGRKHMRGGSGTPVPTVELMDFSDPGGVFDRLFYSPNFTKFVPTNKEISAFWHDLARSPTGRQRMAILQLGEHPIGYPLELLIFTRTPNNVPVYTPEDVRALNRPIVWLQGPIHGNEQDATDGISMQAYRLAMGHWDHYLNRVTVMLMPRINMDGALSLQRGSTIRYDKAIWSVGTPSAGSIFNIAQSIDMNRDNVIFDMPSLRAVHTAFNAYMPEVVGDHHQWGLSTGAATTGGFVEDTTRPRIPCSIHGERVQLLVSRDEAGNVIRSATGGLINMAPAHPRQAEHGGTLHHFWEITWQHGCNINSPRQLQNYYVDKVEPFINDFMANLEAPVHAWFYNNGALGTAIPERFAAFNTGQAWVNGQAVPAEQAPRNARGTWSSFTNVPDGTGYPGGFMEGAMFDPVHMFQAMPLKPAISALIESASSSAHRWPKRVYAQYKAGESLVAFAAANAAEVMQIVGGVRRNIAERGVNAGTWSSTAWSQEGPDLDMVYPQMGMVGAQRTVSRHPFISNGGSASTAGEIIELDVAFMQSRNARPFVWRARPSAYILPLTEANTEVAKRLIFLGARVDVLNETTTVPVERFANPEIMPAMRWVDNARNAPGITPGLPTASQIADPRFVPWTPGFWIKEQPNQLQTATVTVPKGSFVIFMDQSAARSLGTVLEIENERSMTRWAMARKMYAGDYSYDTEAGSSLSLHGQQPAQLFMHVSALNGMASGAGRRSHGN
jgi:hypothetical protein